jgi:hypothetical protein
MMRQFQSVTLNVLLLLLLLLYYSSSDVIPLQGHKLDGKCHPSISAPIPAILHTNSSPSVLPCNLTTRKKSSQCSLHYVPFSCDLTDRFCNIHIQIPPANTHTHIHTQLIFFLSCYAFGEGDQGQMICSFYQSSWQICSHTLISTSLDHEHHSSQETSMQLPVPYPPVKQSRFELF